MNRNQINRRHFLRNSLYAALASSVRASVIGVPASFLLSGRVLAQTGGARYTILAQSQRGESQSLNGPGSFGTGAAALIEHPRAAQLGSAVMGSVGGTDYRAVDLATETTIYLGSQAVLASKPWESLPTSFLNNLACVWYRTGTNAHPEFPSVRRLQGALRDDAQINRDEELASAIALENAEVLGTSLNTPLLLADGGFSRGNPLAVYKPANLKQLFVSSSATLNPDLYSALYTQTIDSVYKNLKKNGSVKQRSFLDNHALTRSQAADFGQSLGASLSDITGNGLRDQLRAATAFISLKVSPVVVVSHDFGGDNHSDSDLADETRDTLNSLDALYQYASFINTPGLSDQLNFATLDCFGRTPIRNREGGRDHYGDMTLGLVHGSNIQGGMIGGLTVDRNNKPVAGGINSTTGRDSDPDIEANSTLSAYGKTLMKAAGIADERLAARVPSGRVISALLK